MARYKIDIQKSNVFLYTSNKHVDTEGKNIIPFTIIQINEIPRCKSNKTCADLYAKTLMKEIKKI